MLARERVRLFYCLLERRPRLHISFINLLYLPGGSCISEVTVLRRNVYGCIVCLTKYASERLVVLSKISRVFNVLVTLSALLYSGLYEYLLEYRFILTQIRLKILVWTTWNTRGCSCAVWITHWISLFLLTERNSKDRQLRKRKIVHLWQFLLQLLRNDSFTSIISWSRKDRSEFILNNPEELARRWGIFKRNKAMTYKKLSRALRYYYQQGIIKRVSQYLLVFVSKIT